MDRILLINRALSYDAGPRRVQGGSGKTYGTSTFSTAHGCQVLELSIEDYMACAEDLSKTWHLALSKWVPMPIPSASKQIQLVGISDEMCAALKAKFGGDTVELAIANSLKNVPRATKQQVSQDGIPAKHFARVGLAKSLGIDPKEHAGKPGSLHAAIAAKLVENKQQAA